MGDKCVPVTTIWPVLGLRMEERPPIWRVAENMLNKQSRRQPTRGGPPARVLGEVLATPYRKNWLCFQTWTGMSTSDISWG
jgi:hypothetical protein